MVSLLLDACLRLPGTYPQKFYVFAESMLQQARLHCHDQIYRLMEVEVYFTSAEHPDPFTHGDALQTQPDIWYWHRKGETYIENSFKGVDISLGGEGRKGGLLIRSLLNTQTGEFIEGTSKVVDALLKQLQCSSIREVVQRLPSLGVHDPKSPLRIEWQPPGNEPIYSAPRVGLTLKQPSPVKLSFLMELYRFCLQPELLTKGKPTLVLAVDIFSKLSLIKPALRQKYWQQALTPCQPLQEKGDTVESQLKLFGWRYQAVMKPLRA